MADFQALLYQYCDAHTTVASPVLQELERQTHLRTLAPQMVSGHLQGRLLSLLSCLIKPTKILEIGTFTGYSAICLAEGLTKSGSLDTIEVNREYIGIALEYFEKAGVKDKINLHEGDALAMLPTMDEEYDLVFVDAAKPDYQQYFDLVFPMVVSGGYLVFDNMLWSGKVVAGDMDKHTTALRDFAAALHAHKDLENILLPVRDGLMLCRKR